MVAWEVGAALEVAQQEGDPHRFESSSTVVDALLEKSTAASEFGNFGLNKPTLLLPSAVMDDFGVGLPVGQLVGRFYKGIEPSGCSGEELKEPWPHGVGGDM